MKSIQHIKAAIVLVCSFIASLSPDLLATQSVAYKLSLNLTSVEQFQLNKAFDLWAEMTCVHFSQSALTEDVPEVKVANNSCYTWDKQKRKLTSLSIARDLFPHSNILQRQLLPLLDATRRDVIYSPEPVSSIEVSAVNLKFRCQLNRLKPVSNRKSQTRKRRKSPTIDYNRPMVQFITEESYGTESHQALHCSITGCSLKNCSGQLCLSDNFKFFISDLNSPEGQKGVKEDGIEDFSPVVMIPEARETEGRYLQCNYTNCGLPTVSHTDLAQRFYPVLNTTFEELHMNEITYTNKTIPFGSLVFLISINSQTLYFINGVTHYHSHRIKHITCNLDDKGCHQINYIDPEDTDDPNHHVSDCGDHNFSLGECDPQGFIVNLIYPYTKCP